MVEDNGDDNDRVLNGVDGSNGRGAVIGGGASVYGRSRWRPSSPFSLVSPPFSGSHSLISISPRLFDAASPPYSTNRCFSGPFFVNHSSNQDMTTKHSRKCCEELVAAAAIFILLKLIRSVSRSTPDQEVLKHTLSTILNLTCHQHLTQVLIDCNGSIETLFL